MITDRELFLKEALREARAGFEEGEVPVGCVIVKGGKILAKAHNQTERLKDPTAHAEIICIRESAKVLGDWRLEGCSVFVSLEPCIMCTYALVLARVKEVIFGATDERHGGIMSLYNLMDDGRLNHRVKWVYHPLSECSELIREFFRRRR